MLPLISTRYCGRTKSFWSDYARFDSAADQDKQYTKRYEKDCDVRDRRKCNRD